MHRIWDTAMTNALNTGTMSSQYCNKQMQNNALYGQLTIMGKLPQRQEKEIITKSAHGQWQTNPKREGGKLMKYCYKYPLSAMGTHFIPRENTTRNLHTWRNSVEGTYKQLDYILISNKQRNWVTQTRTKGTANINSQCQRQLILMKLRIKLKNENEHDNERKRIQFDIDMLRGNKTQLAQQISNEQIQQLLNTPGTLKELD